MRSASSAAWPSTRLLSAESGISTEVDTFSRPGERASTSLRIWSIERWPLLKRREVSPLPSRSSPSSTCSVSMAPLPSWLAS